MALNIVTIEQDEYRNVLKSKAASVSFPLNKEDLLFISELKEKLTALGGVGLAAPQVNYPKKIIVVYIPEEAMLLRDKIAAPYPMHVMINPSYEPLDAQKIAYDFEGCYSVASKAGKVPRYEQIKVHYQDEQGIAHQLNAEGFYARVLQHEIDHVDGFLIIDRLTADCVQGSLEEMQKLRRDSLPLEKQALFDEAMARKLQKS